MKAYPTVLRRFASVAILALASLAMQTSEGAASETSRIPVDSVAYSFVVFGCNRVDRSDTNTRLNPSTSNFAQLDRTFEDVLGLQPHPNILFMAGDLVMGYQVDTVKLARELAAWRSHFETLPFSHSDIRMVPVVGNHETQDSVRVSFAAAERVWLREMAPYIVAHNGPHPGDQDSLVTDQASLSYSFDDGPMHFVTLNTDPVGRDAHVPAHWVGEDLAAARARGYQHLFAIGHKPAFAFDDAESNGLVYSSRDALWSALESNGAHAMLCAHNHIYRRFRPRQSTWMIIAGNGGSPLEGSVSSVEHFYGFTRIVLTKGGRVIEESYGRDIPAEGYLAPCPASAYPTTIRDTFELTRPR